MLTRNKRKLSNSSAADNDHTDTSRRKTVRAPKKETNKPKSTPKKHKIEISTPPVTKHRNSQNGDMSIFISCYNAIETVLVMKYTDVVERLKLLYPAKCTRTLLECRQNHKRNNHIPISDNITMTENFLTNNQPFMYIYTISIDVLKNKFPGRSAIQSLFELILGICEPSGGEYDVKSIINSAAFTITNIMQKFPPCWAGANVQYRDLIKAKKKILLTDSHELLNNRTLLHDIIYCLENVIQHQTVVRSAAFQQDDIAYDSFNDSLQFSSFHQWEMKHSKKFSFDNLKRDDKIDRLFLSLSLFIQLFEADLAVWTIRQNRNPTAKIGKHGKDPLICLMLWENEPIQVNYFIRDILKLYVNYISINFHLGHTQILGKLVNLIFNIFELREIQLVKEKIEYPPSMEHQNHFCDSFTKIIYDIIGCNISAWLNIIKIVEHPRLKLYLVTALLTKIDHKNVKLNPKNIYFTLQEIEKDFEESEYCDDLGANNNVVEKTKRTKENDVMPLKYPCLQKVPKRAIAGELTPEPHAELHLIALNAYIDVFHIKEFHNYWNNYEKLEQEKKLKLDRYRQENDSFENDPIEPFDVEAMEKQKRKSFQKIIKAKGHDEIYGLDVLNTAAGQTKRIEIYINAPKYREDLKFVDKIVNEEMPNVRKRFVSLFPQLSSH